MLLTRLDFFQMHAHRISLAKLTKTKSVILHEADIKKLLLYTGPNFLSLFPWFLSNQTDTLTKKERERERTCRT